jgi:ArsR family transcriptional regulator
MANLFLLRVLRHSAPARILEPLREGERPVGRLQADLELDSSGTSRRAALRRVGVVLSRRAGTSVDYGMRPEHVSEMLAPTRALISRQIETQQSLLVELVAG